VAVGLGVAAGGVGAGRAGPVGDGLADDELADVTLGAGSGTSAAREVQAVSSNTATVAAAELPYRPARIADEPRPLQADQTSGMQSVEAPGLGLDRQHLDV
jgi:hypothetical protein